MIILPLLNYCGDAQLGSLRYKATSNPQQVETHSLSEPRCEKTCLRGFQPGTTQKGLYNHRRWLEA